MTSRRRRSPPASAFLRSVELWNRLAADNASMLFSAGEVIGRRTARMAAHGLAPDAGEQKEMRRMVEEKQSALMEGSLAAWTEWLRLSQAPWHEGMRLALRNGAAMAPLMIGLNPFNAMLRTQSFARGATARSVASAKRQLTAPLDTPLRIADAALAPVRSRVAANRKRLSA